jgi:hypothetical protein
VAQQIEDRKRQEEILWKQKSRIQWLKEGERNTKFFHRTVIQRRHCNRITHLVSDEGETLYSHADLETNLVDYFQDLLTEPIPDRQAAINKITRNIPSLVTQEKNVALLRPFTIEEVDQAMQDTPKCKAPGPDGFTSDFFHYCWPMIRTGSIGNSGGLKNHRKSPPSTQCHFSYLSSQRGAGTSSQAIQTNRSLQCDLQTPYKSDSPKTQANPANNHLSRTIRICGGQANLG